jgi:hypothetical protein
MYGVFRTQHDMFRRVHNMYPHTIIYFVSCALNLCSHYVASEMTKLFQKIQKIPKNTNFSKKSQNFQKKPKFAKKAKICQKSQICQKKSLILAFFFFFFLKFLLFLANFCFFGQKIFFWLF